MILIDRLSELLRIQTAQPTNLSSVIAMHEVLVKLRPILIVGCCVARVEG